MTPPPDRPRSTARPSPSAAPPPSLPPRQLECLRFLDRYWAEHSRFPTHREITAALDLRSQTAALYLKPLRRKGVLRHTGRGHRNWRITPLGRAILAAAAGPPASPGP